MFVLSLFRLLFAKPEVAPWQPLTLQDGPGRRVRRASDALEGTLSGFVRLGGEPLARVVFCGHRASWVDLIRVGELEVATP